jgi:hypothetical protein
MWLRWGNLVVARDMPEEPTAFSLLFWLKTHVEKLPTFVGGAADFGALADATNYAKMLARGGCTHIEIIKKEKLSGSSDLGATSPTLRRSIRNFMSFFWVDFGRAKARKMAEDRRAEVFALSCTWFNFVLWICLVLWFNIYELVLRYNFERYFVGTYVLYILLIFMEHSRTSPCVGFWSRACAGRATFDFLSRWYLC